MNKERIGLAMYTIRDHLKAPADYARCLKQVKQIGYEGVEWSAIDPVIDIKEYRKILDGEGLVCCSNHAGEGNLREQFDTVVENAKLLGCNVLVFPYLQEKYWSEDGVRSIAVFLDETGARLRAEGIRLLYHNHHMEFGRIGNKTILEMIYELTDPRNLWAQLDTYWVQHGGADPVEWIGKMKGRTRHLHCKDKAMLGAECVFAEVGAGNLNWPRIIQAAREAQIEWFLVEQDSSRRDSLESVAMSFRALRNLLG
ncbi:MAG: sugar phosphate isomerase/epimerase [Candidatus Latescibacterota bacterium]